MPSDIGQNPLVLYNWNPATQLQSYLNAQAAVAAGLPGASASIVALGDSTTVGVGSSTIDFGFRNGASYPTDLAKDLAADGVPAQSDDFLGDAPGEDTRITLVGDAYLSNEGASGGYTPTTQSVGSGLDFTLTTPGAYDQLKVDYLDVGTGAVTVSVDGGPATTLQLGNTGQTLTQTIGLPLGLHSEVSIRSTTPTPVYINGAAFENTVAPSVQVYNSGIQSQDSSVANQINVINGVSDPQIGQIPGAIELAPNLVVINYGINDIHNGVLTAAQTTANIAKMVADFQANGIDVIIVIPQPFDSPNYLTEIPVLRADLHAVADAMNVPIIDLSATYNDDFQALSVAGLMADQLHPNAMLYADIAANYAKLLTSSASIAATGSTLVTQAGVISTLSGSANAVTGAVNSVLNVAGNGNSVMSGAGATVNITGSNNTVASTDGITVNLAGSGGTVIAGSASHVAVQDGRGIAVSASASTLFVQTGVGSSLSGSGNAVTVEHGSQLNVGGGGNLITASGGDTVNVAGTGNTISSADAISVNLAGDSNAVGTGAGGYVNVQQGINVAINAYGSTLITSDGVGVALAGSGNTFTVGHASLLNANGDGNSVVASDGARVNAAGNGNTVTSAGGIGVNLAGNGNTVTAGAPSAIGVLSGNNVTVNASGSALVTQDGVGASLHGSGNTVTTGHGSLFNLAGGGNLVMAANGARVNAAGSGNAVTSAGGLGVNLAGDGNTVTVGAPSTISLIYGSNIAVNASASTLVTQAGVGASLHGSGNTVTAGSGSSTAVYGSANTVFAGNAASQTSDVSPIDLVSVGGNANLVFLGSGRAQIDDASSNLTLVLPGPSLAAARGIDIINGFGAARGAVVDLTGGAGGYATAAAAFQAIVPDGHGGSLLALTPTASLDFAGLPQNGLSAANFRVG